jgi:peptidoglycan-N-acetylglucosamine deacetylase
MTGSPRWHPSRLLQFSIGLHAAAAIALALQPPLWPWWLGALLANHAALTAAGLWPRSTWLGPNLLRLPAAAVARREICITIDDGPDPAVTPAVLDILDRYDARASFFLIGEQAARHPALAREIVRRGHSVENHSLRHSVFFSFYGIGRFRREIGEAQRLIAAAAGAQPTFFRAPAGLRNPLLDPALAGSGLRYVAWTRRGFDTVTGDARTVLDRLCRGLAAGDILLLHDAHSAPTPAGRAVILEVLPPLLERARAAGLAPVSLPMAMRP